MKNLSPALEIAQEAQDFRIEQDQGDEESHA
jgi:hypothetical protein